MSRRVRWSALLVSAVSLTVGALVAGPAQAAFPGRDGRIAFAYDFQYCYAPMGHPQWCSAHLQPVKAVDPATGRVSGIDPWDAGLLGPVFSPDGTRLAGVRAGDAGGPVFEERADGGGRAGVPAFAGLRDTPPTSVGYTPDGRLYSVGNGELNVSDGPLGPLHPILSFPSGDTLIDRLGRVSWAADGSRIVFGLTDTTAPFFSRIWTAGTDGSSPQPLVAAPDTSSDSDPDLSPDGREVAFIRRSPSADGLGGFPPDLYVSDVATGATRRLTTTGDVTGLAWAPAGDRIAILTSSPENGDRLETVSPDGTGREVLYKAPSPLWTVLLGEPTWQPLP